MTTIQVFKYVETLDAFLITTEFHQLAERLGLIEWHPAVWLGRLFLMDNDFGEHWFDNWNERELLEDQALALGIESSELMIVVPDHFTDGRDGPCHSPAIRKIFWTDVLRSLRVSAALLFEVARWSNEQIKDILPDE